MNIFLAVYEFQVAISKLYFMVSNEIKKNLSSVGCLKLMNSKYLLNVNFYDLKILEKATSGDGKNSNLYLALLHNALEFSSNIS